MPNAFEMLPQPIRRSMLDRVLAFDVAAGGGPGGHLWVELTEGTGHGARIILMVTGTDPGEPDGSAHGSPPDAPQRRAVPAMDV